MLDILYYKDLPDCYVEEVWRLLCESDNEFIPPLSSRNSSKQMNLGDSASSCRKPYEYFQIMKEQEFLLLIDNSILSGFMTFIPGYENPELLQFNPSLYVTTVIVDRKKRGEGITYRFYDEIIKVVSNKNLSYITTRTWSTNESHIHILNKCDFILVNTLKDHRGKGINTIYFGRKIS